MLLLVLSPAISQSANPFEILPRLSKNAQERMPAAEADTAAEPLSTNPFDIIRQPSTANNNNKVTISPPLARPELPAEDSSVFRFVIVVFILSMLAFLLTILRSIAVKTFSAFINNNMLNQLFRDQEGRGISPFILLYVMFLINLGILLFFAMDAYNVRPFSNQIGLFLFCLALSFGLFLGKHLLLSMIGFIFPVKKEISRYHFLIIIYGIVIGFILVPFNLFFAFGPELALRKVMFVLSIMIGSVYAYRYIRGMAIASKFLVFHKFHFLLYICTIEIMPVIIMLKILQNGV